MAVAADICVAWPSLAANIPAGWTRETALDARYILGAGSGADTDLTTDRGSTTHTHTSPSHTPLQDAHTHTISAAGGDAGSLVAGNTSVGADQAHGHDGFPSASATGTNNGIAITVDATSNDLAHVEVIWIKSDGSPAALPSGCLAFFASDTLPSGWTRAHGNRYLKGAAAAGNGGATAGSNTHTHTSPAHTHTQNSHLHSAVTSSPGNTAVGRGAGAQTISSTGHTHSVSLISATPTNQSVTTTIDATNHEPPFKKLNVISAGSDSLPDQVIALWLGTNASIPTDWARFTSMDGKWLKAANADGESNVTTGGAAQHGHTASDCQPIQDAHSHTPLGGTPTGTVGSNPAGVNNLAAPDHTHAWSCSSDVATNQAVAVTINDCSADAALPKHRTVIFVQFTAPAAPARAISGYTSYTVGRFGIGDPEAQVLPEVAKRMAQGDLRFFPR